MTRSPSPPPDVSTSPRPVSAAPLDGGAAVLSRVDRYFFRVDSHLRVLADDSDRRAFLDAQFSRWERAYDLFIATEGGSAPGCDAADFTLVLSGLGKRLAQLRRAA